MESNIENILLQMILAIEDGRIEDYLNLRILLFDLLAVENGKPNLKLVK